MRSWCHIVRRQEGVVILLLLARRCVAIRILNVAVLGVLMIGHNPGLAKLAAGLVASVDPRAEAAYRPSFPTASVAILRFDGAWRELDTNSCHLQAFATPNVL